MPKNRDIRQGGPVLLEASKENPEAESRVPRRASRRDQREAASVPRRDEGRATDEGDAEGNEAAVVAVSAAAHRTPPSLIREACRAVRLAEVALAALRLSCAPW